MENGLKNNSGINPKQKNKIVPAYANPSACSCSLVYLQDKFISKFRLKAKKINISTGAQCLKVLSMRLALLCRCDCIKQIAMVICYMAQYCAKILDQIRYKLINLWLLGCDVKQSQWSIVLLSAGLQPIGGYYWPLQVFCIVPHKPFVNLYKTVTIP